MNNNPYKEAFEKEYNRRLDKLVFKSQTLRDLTFKILSLQSIILRLEKMTATPELSQCIFDLKEAFTKMHAQVYFLNDEMENE